MARRTSAAAPEPLLHTVPEAARMLSISAGTAWMLIRKGELPSVRLGHRVLIPRAELLAHIAQLAQQGRAS